jgi:hypothetical protein
VSLWEETEYDGGLWLRVIFEPINPRHVPLALLFTFSAENVRYLEGLKGNDDDE